MDHPEQYRVWLAPMRLRATHYFVAIAIALAPVFLQPFASAQTFHRLYSFKGDPDGRIPVADLVRDSAGNLYGTTQFGGAFKQSGTVFKLDTNRKETILHNFCSESGCSDGAFPVAGLVRDAAGNLYGTTQAGGRGCFGMGCGVVFKLDKTGKETVLHRFSGKSDGSSPVGDLVLDPAGNIYGTTELGGSFVCRAQFGCGVVFKLDKTGKETVLHTFTGKSAGAGPLAGLFRDSAGNLYGTTAGGGSLAGACSATSGCGVIFTLDTHSHFKVLYIFTYGPAGANPQAQLVADSAGNLYGTTPVAGDSTVCHETGCGVVFKLDTTGKYTVLHAFTFLDGTTPNGKVVLDDTGNIYGTTSSGGGHNLGEVFKLDASGTLTLLRSFKGTDGFHPDAGLIRDTKGTLYGTTDFGGADCIADTCGVVFSLHP
jgi:uncharacterized repeat protein (TIGR03803 family)